MRHLVRGRKLNRTAQHRKALMTNLAIALVEHKRIKTTVPRAKELRGFAERLVTFAKKGDLAARREVLKRVKDRDTARILFDELGPRYQERAGGYTRVIKLPPRQGDNADMAIIEFVDYEGFTGVAEDTAE